MYTRSQKTIRQATLASALTMTMSFPIFADENKAEPKARKSESSQSYTFRVDENGNIEKSIDKIEAQLEKSNLPEEIRKQTLEVLRSVAERGNGQAGVVVQMQGSNNQPGQWQVRTWPGSGEGRISFPMQIPVKNRLLKSIEKIVDEEKLEPEVAARLIDKLNAAVESGFQVDMKPTINTTAQRYRIGVVVDKDADEPKEAGVRVSSVFEDSPAGKAGIKEGERILSVNGKELESPEHLIDIVQDAGAAGKELEVVVKSESEEKTLTIKPTQNAAGELNFFNFPQMGGPNQSQAWLMNPQDLQSMRNQFQFRIGGDQTGNMNETIAQAVKDAVAAAVQGQALAKEKAKAGDEKASPEEEERELDEEILKELAELEREVSQIKSMLKELIEKK